MTNIPLVSLPSTSHLDNDISELEISVLVRKFQLLQMELLARVFRVTLRGTYDTMNDVSKIRKVLSLFSTFHLTLSCEIPLNLLLRLIFQCNNYLATFGNILGYFSD